MVNFSSNCKNKPEKPATNLSNSSSRGLPVLRRREPRLLLLQYFYINFEIKRTFTVTEEAWNDPSLPYLQSISYKTLDADESGCSELLNLYDAMSLSAVSKSVEIELCGSPVDITDLVEKVFENNPGGGYSWNLILESNDKDSPEIFSLGKYSTWSPFTSIGLAASWA